MADSRSSLIARYLAGRAISGPWKLDGCPGTGFAGAVVIPSLAEQLNLSATLGSLATNPAELLERFLVIVVVNNRPDAPQRYKEDNMATLASLAETAVTTRSLNFAWVDAAREGRELPVKGGGVGMARKIGMDLALGRLACDTHDPILISLDADTIVRPDYLQAIIDHFERSTAGGAVIPFRHQESECAEQQQAIDRYELFLRSYVLGLEQAGSPYAFHTIGSALACRASAYAKMGGMNTRAAGEDFYFLQQLHRVAGVERLQGTILFPSCRASDRVPFGTGRSMTRLLAREQGAVLFYRTECFRTLQKWLEVALASRHLDGSAIRQHSERISPQLGEYLNSTGLEQVWDRLRRHHREESLFARAFHEWFDGLKTMKLIHHLSHASHSRCEPEESLPDLFEWCGFPPVKGLSGQLSLLREKQQPADSLSAMGKALDYSPFYS